MIFANLVEKPKEDNQFQRQQWRFYVLKFGDFVDWS